MKHLYRTLLRIRQRLLPEQLELGWMPIYSLGYLLFLFMPWLFDLIGSDAGQSLGPVRMRYTLLSVLLFLPLYFLCYRAHPAARFGGVLAMGVLCYVLLPYNAFANTYLIYAASFIPFIGMPLSRGILLLICQLVVLLLELMVLRYPLFIFGITLLISASAFFGNHYFVLNRRKQAALQLSHNEVRRLAASAERERIGRDLHDLLGHTLSLVALKSELAGKLLEREPQAARREIDEVSRVAREALSQVRRAVTGIRAAGLAAELASARVLLEPDGVAVRYTLEDLGLPPPLETALALTLREAVTNIQRHARARRVEIEVAAAAHDEVLLSVRDDGRGSALVPGNGLTGMRERLQEHGGRLQVDALPGQGVHLRAWLPRHSEAQPDAMASAANQPN